MLQVLDRVKMAEERRLFPLRVPEKELERPWVQIANFEEQNELRVLMSLSQDPLAFLDAHAAVWHAQKGNNQRVIGLKENI